MAAVGLMFLASGIVAAASELMAGTLADRLGRRRVLLASTAAGVMTSSALAVLIGAAAPVWSIMLTYIIRRAMSTMLQPAISAMVADLTPPRMLTETYALLRVGGNVGFAAGPAIGGYLASFVPYSWLFGFAALTSVLTMLLIVFLLQESSTGQGRRVGLSGALLAARDRKFLLFCALSLLVFTNMGQLGSTLSVFAVDHLGFSTAQYGLLLTFNGLLVVLFQYPVARGAGRLLRHRGLMLGAILYAWGYFSLSWVRGFNWALGSIVLITAGEVVFSPLTSSVVAEQAPLDERGRYMGLFGLSQTIGIAVGPLLGGLLLDGYMERPMFVWGTVGLVSFAASAGFHFWGRSRQVKT